MLRRFSIQELRPWNLILETKMMLWITYSSKMSHYVSLSMIDKREIGLDNENRAYEGQIKLYEHIENDLKNKNAEIVRLERRLIEVENV